MRIEARARARRFAARFARGEGGAALVEAALILPVLIVLVFATCDLALYFWQRSLAAKAVDLGVRAAIVSDAVAVGPGLTPALSAEWWYGRPPGLPCAGDGACPAFRVTCTQGPGCTCPGGCRFSYSAENLGPILAAMRAVLPGLEARQVEVTYATNGLGYVARPPPVPVDVTVRLVGLAYEPVFAGLLLRGALPLAAQASLPGESLGSPR